jgi:Phage tail assembly chaperone protein, TAC
MPQAELKEKVIDEVTYQIGMLPPRKAQVILVDILKVAGPALAAVATAVKGGSILDADIDFQKVASQLALNLDVKTLEAHQNELADVTLANGKQLRGIFDAHFRGRIMHLYKWHAFALEANFSDFSDALASVSSRLKSLVKAEPASSSQNTSTPASGG